jgi:ribosomal protein S12 methylthiotransferase
MLSQEPFLPPMNAIKTKVGFVSLGCPKNLVDSEVMMGILSREGYELTPRADEAEILVVNTCSFIESAQKESVDAILEMAEHKKFGAARKLIVAGCLVERYRAQILEQVPEVDAVVGTGEVERIMEAVEGDLRVLPATPPAFLYHDLTPRIITTPRHAAYIKIAEGCDHPCSFCIIPQLRGKFRSRRFESVLREAENLVAGGAREITLIGQDTTSYGEDLGLRDGLALLLEKLAQIGGETAGDAQAADGDDLLWVRFLYAYPNRVTQKMLDTLAAYPRLAKYMDMPLQHASRNVLARMKRGGNGDSFLKLLERIRATIPGVALRTSFIAGFPGETDADFAELCDFVKAARLDWMGVFEYSDVDNAGSFALDEKVDAETIRGRRNELMAIQKKISRERLKRFREQRVMALVEGPSKDNPLVWEARLEGMAPDIDGKVYLTDIELPNGDVATAGDVARVEITKTDAYDLIGRVVEIIPRRRARRGEMQDAALKGGATTAPPEQLHRIATGAALRVLA